MSKTVDVPCSEADGCREIELVDSLGRVQHRLWVEGPMRRVESVRKALDDAGSNIDVEWSYARITGRRLDARVLEDGQQ